MVADARHRGRQAASTSTSGRQERLAGVTDGGDEAEEGGGGGGQHTGLWDPCLALCSLSIGGALLVERRDEQDVKRPQFEGSRSPGRR
jgi:hypothetical protein